MDFIFDDNDAAVVRSVDDQLVGGQQLDAADISPELGHQIIASSDHARPTQVVADLVRDVVGDDVEEVLTVDESP
jgi:hypothetical protein